MSEEIVRWGKPDPEVEVSLEPDGIKRVVFPRMSINLTWYNPDWHLGDILPTFHPYENEVWLHNLNLYDEDDMIAVVASTLKLNDELAIRVRGTNMKTLNERGEQFARFNFEINFHQEQMKLSESV